MDAKEYIKYLYNELAPGTDPLGEDNKLMLCNGVLGKCDIVRVIDMFLRIQVPPFDLLLHDKSHFGSQLELWDFLVRENPRIF